MRSELMSTAEELTSMSSIAARGTSLPAAAMGTNKALKANAHT